MGHTAFQQFVSGVGGVAGSLAIALTNHPVLNWRTELCEAPKDQKAPLQRKNSILPFA